MTAQAAHLPDGRLHLQHGPIDCLCRAWGAPDQIARAYANATETFPDILPTLCTELPILRAPLPSLPPREDIARAMHAACVPFADRFITPMAAVAGAVADHLLAAMLRGTTLARAYVNDGGDIAFHLTAGQTLRCGLVADLAAPALDAVVSLAADQPARGIATSGRACKGQGGRSFSFGIADAVTVLATTAARRRRGQRHRQRRRPARPSRHHPPPRPRHRPGQRPGRARHHLAGRRADRGRGGCGAGRRPRRGGRSAPRRADRGRRPHTRRTHALGLRTHSGRNLAMIRKLLTVIEETHQEGTEDIKPPTRKAAAIAVIANPFAGRPVEDLAELIEIGAMLGALLGERAVRALGIEPHQAQSYGKAAIVGENGELEHAAAILHPKLGAPLRTAVEKGAALVPSAKKRGGMGATIDVPLGHKDAAFVRSHFDAMEIRVPDAPRAGEIVVAVVVTDSGRPRPRIGGLTVDQIEGKDGLR
jgi:ApbE superfamily uncharacterized protein (UPF0280 family)